MNAHEIEREIRGHGRPRGGHPLTLMDACQLAEIVIREVRGGGSLADRILRRMVDAHTRTWANARHALAESFLRAIQAEGEAAMDCRGEDHSATRGHGCHD